MFQIEISFKMRKFFGATNRLWLMAVISCCLAACSTGSKSDAADFTTFYEQFHRDADYQMAHITFPLEGLPSDADAETIATGDFRWEAEDWELQRPFDVENSDFKRELIKFGDDLVIEKIVHQTGSYGTIRRFAKMGDEWYLIYYAGLNRIEQ